LADTEGYTDSRLINTEGYTDRLAETGECTDRLAETGGYMGKQTDKTSDRKVISYASHFLKSWKSV
jgi:hypothetical protein